MRRAGKFLSQSMAILLLVAILAGCGAPPGDISTSSSGVSAAQPSSEAPAGGTPPESVSDYDTTVFYATQAEYEEETGAKISNYGEAPDLAEKVKSGDLPAVEERISAEPMVVVPLEDVGTYGGRIRSAATSPVTGSAETWTMRTQPLFIVGSDLQSIAPNVAKGWEFNDDYTELTIYLREGMKWSDGTDFNADAFEFYYDAILNNDELKPRGTEIEIFMYDNQLAEFTRVNDYEVKYTYAGPKPSVVSAFGRNNRMYLSVPYAPGHYLEQFHIDYNPDAAELASENGYESWSQYFLYIYPDEVQARMEPDLPCIDPWVLARVDEVGNKYFDRNPYYWKIDTEGNQLPYIDGQDRLLMDAETIRLKLPAGELDVGLQFTSIDDYELYKENEEKGDYRTSLWVDARGSVLCNFRFNLNLRDEAKSEIFNTLAFREALSLGLDRSAINDVIWKGLATPRAATVSPSVSFYEDQFGEYLAQYDPETASAKLDEIGMVIQDGEEFRSYPNGDPFELNIEYSTFEGNITTALEMVQQNWQAIGVKTNLRIIDTALQAERQKSGDLDFWVWNVDNGTEFGFYSDPMFYTPDALEWDLYLRTDGAEGTKPSPEYEEYVTKVREFQSYPIGDENYTRLGKELLTLSAENVWNVGVAGLTPKPMIVKNGLKNTPYEGVYDYDYRFWMIFHPEQWYWAA